MMKKARLVLLRMSAVIPRCSRRSKIGSGGWAQSSRRSPTTTQLAGCCCPHSRDLDLAQGAGSFVPRLYLSKAVAIQVALMFESKTLRHLNFKLIYCVLSAFVLGVLPCAIRPSC